MHQNVWRRKNLLIRHSRAAKQLFNYSFKKVQKQPPDVFCKKSVVKNFANFTGKHPCWSHFLNKVPGLQPASFLKKDSSAFQHKCFPVKFAKLLRIPKNIFKRLLLEVSMKKAAINNLAMFTRRKQLVTNVLCKRYY